MKLSTYYLTIFIYKIGTKLFRQIVGIPMGTNFTLLMFCYERDFMMSLSEEKQFEVIEAFNGYLDHL